MCACLPAEGPPGASQPTAHPPAVPPAPWPFTAALQEDQQWARTLDEAWDLGSIRAVVQSALDARQDAAFWLVRARLGAAAG